MVIASYLVNKGRSAAIDFKTLEDKWFGVPPNQENLRIFGYPTYAHIKQGKLEPRAIKGSFCRLARRYKRL